MSDEKKEALNMLIELFKNNPVKITVYETGIWSNTGWTYENPLRTFDWYMIIDGKALMAIGGKNRSIAAGDTFFIDNSIKNTCQNGKFTVFGCSFTVATDIDGSKELESKMKDGFKKLTGIIFSLGKNNLKDFCFQIYDEFIHNREKYEHKISLLISLVFIEIYRQISTKIPDGFHFKYTGNSKKVSEIILYLSENLGKNISLDDLSRIYKLSPRYLSSIFKNVTGYPIIKYQQRLKIEKAKRLLSTSSMSVLEIALELNFTSGQYLSHLFSKLNGITPTEYRKQFTRSNENQSQE
jgi:AraC-like DNA-binding protein